MPRRSRIRGVGVSAHARGVMLRAPRTRPVVDGVGPSARWIGLAWSSMPIGVGIAGVSMWMASWVVDPSATLHFAVFWCGVLLALLPAASVLLHPATRSGDRLCFLTAIGVLTAIPKFLAYPGGPAYFDEYAHWSQIERLHDEGLAFMANRQVVVVGDYPAMHVLAAGIRHLTGLSTYHTGVLLVAAFHVLCLLGVYAIAIAVTRSPSVGSIAALWYAVGPGLWYFNSQFAYESFGVTLFIWSTCCLSYFVSVRTDAADRDRWLIVGLAVCVVLAATHHLSSYANAFVLLAFVCAVMILRILRRESSTNVAEVVIYVGAAIGFTAWWFITQAPNTRAYLEPYIQGGLADVVKLRSGNSKGGGAQRQLFAGSTIPTYEQVLSFLVPFLSAGIFALAMLTQWRRGLRVGAAVAMSMAGAGFYVVYPLMLSETGAEGARRSWSFTNIGVAVVVALAAASLVMRRQRWQRGVGAVAILATLTTMLIGNIAIGSNEEYRMPGVYVYGSDTRSVTAEMVAAARWLRDTQGPNQPFVGDRTAQIVFSKDASASLAVPSDANPVWNLVIQETPLSPDDVGRMNVADMRFIVLDKHSLVQAPKIRFYLDHAEPEAGERTEPLGAGSFAKFDNQPWIQRVYSSDTLDIFRVLTNELLRFSQSGGG